jgi:hypothetical protein
MDKTKLHRAPLLIAAATALSVTLGACGSGGSPGAPSSGQGGVGSSSAAQSGQAQFAQCMRQNGVTSFPDPKNGHFVMSGGSGIQTNPHFKSAIQTCQHFLGPGGIGQHSNGSQQAMLAFAQCMQTHGVPSFPDPASDGALVAPAGVDTASPTFQKAWSTCQAKLPGGGSGAVG